MRLGNLRGLPIDGELEINGDLLKMKVDAGIVTGKFLDDVYESALNFEKAAQVARRESEVRAENRSRIEAWELLAKAAKEKGGPEPPEPELMLLPAEHSATTMMVDARRVEARMMAEVCSKVITWWDMRDDTRKTADHPEGVLVPEGIDVAAVTDEEIEARRKKLFDFIHENFTYPVLLGQLFQYVVYEAAAPKEKPAPPSPDSSHTAAATSEQTQS